MNLNGGDYIQFWAYLEKYNDRPAVIDHSSGTAIEYRQLAALTRQGAAQLRDSRKGLACLPIRNDVEGIACYLSLLSSGHVVYICGANIGTTISPEFIERYQPELVYWRGQERPSAIAGKGYQDAGEMFGYRVAKRVNDAEKIYPELAILLSTSGTTGSSKTVRLSYANVAANAGQIVQALNVEPTENVILSLPLQYAYGLSVLHSTFSVGACLIISKRIVMEPGFWDVCRARKVTTVPAVPTMLKFLQSMGMDKIPLPSLRKITVAGAAMDDPTRRWLVSQALSKRIQVYSMYGMTEATARIAVLPPEEFAIRPESVGRALSQGELHILSSGEIVYRGPNVMLGYANDRSDLERADLLSGVLNTGDLGSLDGTGNLYVTGRLARICKILGVRIDLTDVERQLAHGGDVAVVSNDEIIRIFHTHEDESTINACVSQLAKRWRIPQSALVLKRVQAIPRTDNGKIRYSELWNYEF